MNFGIRLAERSTKKKPSEEDAKKRKEEEKKGGRGKPRGFAAAAAG